MVKSSEFNIPFIGLKDGRHDFTFEIDNTFFANFDYLDFHKSHFDINVTLNKKATHLEFHFEANGYVTIPCDLSTELFDLPLTPSDDLVVKFGSTIGQLDDHILVIPVGSFQVDISQQIYEMILLAVPQKNIHPGVADGSLSSEIIDKLKELAPKEKAIKQGDDPRWDKLKDLLK